MAAPRGLARGSEGEGRPGTLISDTSRDQEERVEPGLSRRGRGVLMRPEEPVVRNEAGRHCATSVLGGVAPEGLGRPLHLSTPSHLSGTLTRHKCVLDQAVLAPMCVPDPRDAAKSRHTEARGSVGRGSAAGSQPLLAVARESPNTARTKRFGCRDAYARPLCAGVSHSQRCSPYGGATDSGFTSSAEARDRTAGGRNLGAGESPPLDAPSRRRF